MYQSTTAVQPEDPAPKTGYKFRTNRLADTINEITSSVQQYVLPASARPLPPHPSPDLPATPVAQPPSRSRPMSLRTLRALLETRTGDCDA